MIQVPMKNVTSPKNRILLWFWVCTQTRGQSTVAPFSVGTIQVNAKLLRGVSHFPENYFRRRFIMKIKMFEERVAHFITSYHLIRNNDVHNDFQNDLIEEWWKWNGQQSQ
jgi:hypothetical protein